MNSFLLKCKKAISPIIRNIPTDKVIKTLYHVIDEKVNGSSRKPVFVLNFDQRKRNSEVVSDDVALMND